MVIKYILLLCMAIKVFRKRFWCTTLRSLYTRIFVVVNATSSLWVSLYRNCITREYVRVTIIQDMSTKERPYFDKS